MGYCKEGSVCPEESPDDCGNCPERKRYSMMPDDEAREYDLLPTQRMAEDRHLHVYFDWMANTIGCDVNELGLVNIIGDGEGDELAEFFDDDFYIVCIGERNVANTAIGDVYIIELRSGEIFVAEQNASPYIVYGRKDAV